MNDIGTLLLYMFGIVGVGLFLWVVISEAVSRGNRLDRERQEREKRERGRQ